ncbi:helix-turn-helix domain-containing protein [Mycolicibacterium mageritense]|uniref:helix-turn-helix domain-containing protein n=1 Tax=Mycolicibacterium mageritense TaxID=53462 RepID=UPI0011D48D25|nr:helix-turn-helix transcriptional regulator [Mycolicibacterium mageritense]TXI63305.1 MAG: XRE family transcriptional regulator [Mycolicibacterium mageritense]
MADEQPKRKNPIGATGKTVADNVKRLRLDQGLAFTELASKLDAIGKPIPTLGLRHIESYKRRVDSDDLVALAVVLGVSPATLLMPGRNEDGSEVERSDLVPITGWRKPIAATAVWRWLTAEEPLIHGTFGTFVDRALPVWYRDEVTGRYRNALKQGRSDAVNDILDSLEAGGPAGQKVAAVVRQTAEYQKMMKKSSDGDD